MTNDLVPQTIWNNRKFLFFTRYWNNDQYKNLWDCIYKKNREMCYSLVRFNKPMIDINRNINKFIGKVGYRDMAEELDIIIRKIWNTKPIFFHKHFIVHRIKYKKTKVYLYGFSQQMYSYILHNFNLQKELRSYLDFMFSETEENKKLKERELAGLYDKCMGWLKQGEKICLR